MSRFGYRHGVAGVDPACRKLAWAVVVSSTAVQPILALLSDAPGGDPTQYMAEKAFAHHRLDWRYLTFEVPPEALGDAVRGVRALGFRGAHCAGQHRRTVVPLLDRLTDKAEQIGAVNVILREERLLVGANTEGRGLLEALGRAGDPAGKRVVLLGAGKVARAVAVELAAAGVGRLAIVNRTELHARQLADLVAEQYATEATTTAWTGDYAPPPETDVVVHATPFGHEDPEAPLALDLADLSPQALVADLTWDVPQTWLLREAGRRGCRTLAGLEMYIEQVAAAITLWTDVVPDRDVMREAAEEFLEL